MTDGELRRLLEDVLDVVNDQSLSVLAARLLAITRDATQCGRAVLTLSDDPAGPTVIVSPQATADASDRTDTVPYLAVPIVLRGREAGTLSVYEPSGPRRAGSAELHRIDIVARAAVTLVERSRTAQANRAREAWAAAGADVAREITAGRIADPLRLVVSRIALLADADSVAVLRAGTAEGSVVVVAADHAEWDPWRGGDVVIPDGIIAAVLMSGQARAVADLRQRALPATVARPDLGPVAVVPMMGSGSQYGAIVLGRRPGRPAIPAATVGMATMFASTVTLALELADMQQQRDELLLVEERDRVARDLHDHVIQRLYAIGLGLQSAPDSGDPDTRARLARTVDDVDDTIAQIRSTIFGLRSPLIPPGQSLRARAESLVDELSPVLGFRPHLVVEGPVDFGVDEGVIDDCEAVLRESLTNVARHAQATDAEVALRVADGRLSLEIRDDGRGIGEATRRSGLANVRARAERHGGSMQVRSSPGEGTRIVWSIRI